MCALVEMGRSSFCVWHYAALIGLAGPRRMLRFVERIGIVHGPDNSCGAPRSPPNSTTAERVGSADHDRARHPVGFDELMTKTLGTVTLIDSATTPRSAKPAAT